jgi:very-short-patch-repair endonuclease
MRYYCSNCKETISKKVYEYSKNHFGKALCMNHQRLQKTKKQDKTSKSKVVFGAKRLLSAFNKRLSSPKITREAKKSSYASKKTNSKITPQAKKLYTALNKKGIKCKLEAYDGYKHVDISIGWAKLNVEIDGRHHILSPKQLYSDIQRDSYSQEDGIGTIRIPNEEIDKDVNKVANSIAKVARRRYSEKR